MKRVAVGLSILAMLTMCAPASAGGGNDELVDVLDFAFVPDNVTTDGNFDDRVVWFNDGAQTHTATTKLVSNLGPYHSTGPLANNESDAFDVLAAGTFKYFCEFHDEMKGRFAVPLIHDPTGVVGVAETITYAEALNSPYVNDVQVKKPGKRFRTIADNDEGTSTTFTATKPGTYKFRARVVSQGFGTSKWSPVSTITFS